MLHKLTKAKSSIHVFFPIIPMPGSPYAQSGRCWETTSGQPDIRFELENLLRSDPSVISGYSVRRVDGVWFNEDTTQWETDEICEILAFVAPGFVKNLRGPDRRSAPRRFIARIGQLSCVGMGHASFWCIVEGRSLEEISSEGMSVEDQVISFEDILSEG